MHPAIKVLKEKAKDENEFTQMLVNVVQSLSQEVEQLKAQISEPVAQISEPVK